jgi:hypothetical protein
VPDDFEKKVLGQLLEDGASPKRLVALRLAWQKERLSLPPSEFLLTTPLPDSFPANCDANGQIVHGMTGGKKLGIAKTN